MGNALSTTCVASGRLPYIRSAFSCLSPPPHQLTATERKKGRGSGAGGRLGAVYGVSSLVSSAVTQSLLILIEEEARKGREGEEEVVVVQECCREE